MRLTSIKDCKNCDKALVYGSKDTPIVKCNSVDCTHTKLFKELGRHCAGQCKGYNKSESNRAGEIGQSQAAKFILAGNSEFILHSTKTNEDFIFNIVREKSKDNAEKYVYFVNVLHGHDRTYAGILVKNEETKDLEFKQGKNGKLTSNDLNIRSLVFVVNKLLKGDTVGNLEFYHIGKCGCCGNKLITEEDVEKGLCTNCIKAMEY